MNRLSIAAVAAAAAVLSIAPRPAAQAGAAFSVKLNKAAMAAEVKNDQRTMLVPASGRTFLWVSATLSGAATDVDLTRVVLTSGADTYPLIGVDSAFDGDPNQFSMIAPAMIKGGAMDDPLEETRSIGSIGFAFTPGKAAVLKVIQPPQSFCLVFSVKPGVRAGEIRGLGPKPLPLPPVAP
jgi:hypothetical protein